MTGSAAALLAGVFAALAVAVWRGPAPGAGPRRAADDEAVPVVVVADVAELLALALRSGCGVLEAIETVGAQLDGVPGRHLRAVAAAQRWGLSSGQAWAGVPPAWEPVARALRLADRAGAAPAALLLDAAADVRAAEEHRLDVATARLGVRVVLPLGLTFLPAFVATTVVPVVVALAGAVLRG